MSMGRLATVVRLPGLSHLEFRVLSVLADAEDDTTGVCRPSYRMIADAAECSTRAVSYTVTSLEKKGFISSEREGCNGNSYKFLFNIRTA